jgi:hypothetical protein
MANTYATFDPTFTSGNITFSNGNLTITCTSAGAIDAVTRSTISKSSGKWYWEYHVDAMDATHFDTGGYVINGSFLTSQSTFAAANSWGFGRDGGSLYRNSNGTLNSNTSNLFVNGDTLGMAWDADANTLQFYVNNTLVSLSSGVVSSVGNPGYASVYISFVNALTANFGATALTYTPPAGYNAGLYIAGSSALPAPINVRQAVKRASFY